MLKNIDKKYLYILGALIGIPIVLILFLALIKGCSSGKSSYESYEKKMVSAAEKYFTNKKILPITEGGTVTVTLDELVKGDYIKNPEKKLDDKTCIGSVTVRNNGVSFEKNDGGFYVYIPNLSCDKYNTVHLIDKLKEDIVTEKSCLYETSDGFVYKGAKVNNYVKFSGSLYRIISIDNNNVLKLIKDNQEKDSYIWDKKYNLETKQNDGTNDFSDSIIIDTLYDFYSSFNKDDKKHIMAYNACYGNRSETYTNKDTIYECSKTIDNLFVGLMNTFDYFNASYDSNCIAYDSPSCRNYNYLYDMLDDTWLMNGISDNSYYVFYYSTGYFELSKANSYRKVNIVINIDGNEVYTKGDGSLDNPYVINN